MTVMLDKLLFLRYYSFGVVRTFLTEAVSPPRGTESLVYIEPFWEYVLGGIVMYEILLYLTIILLIILLNKEK